MRTVRARAAAVVPTAYGVNGGGRLSKLRLSQNSYRPGESRYRPVEGPALMTARKLESLAPDKRRVLPRERGPRQCIQLRTARGV